MQTYKKSLLVITAVLLFSLLGATLGNIAAVLAAPTFTGDAPNDFTDSDTIVVPDPSGIDVGVPSPPAPASTISGWDMETVYFDYDWDTDTMYVGVHCFGEICSDADSDGDPGNTSGWLNTLGGTDPADYGYTEGFALLIDVDNDCNADPFTACD